MLLNKSVTSAMTFLQSVIKHENVPVDCILNVGLFSHEEQTSVKLWTTGPKT